MKFRYAVATLSLFALMGADGNSCASDNSSDGKQRAQQERILSEGTSQVGMPAIVNFRERKLLKEIFEMRDQASFVTYSYFYVEMTGKLVFLCQSIGYPIPYATQFTSPQKDTYYTTSSSPHISMPQADPNGLFSPAAADGTWVLCKDPHGPDVKPVYVEPKVTTSPFKLD